MFACLQCQERFTSEDAGRFQEFEPTEAFGVRASVDVSLIACPACGGTEVDEFTPGNDPEGEAEAFEEIRRCA